MRTYYGIDARAFRVPLVSTLLALCLLWAPRAAAQKTRDDATKSVARELGIEGIQAFQKNDLTTADQKLERAYRLFAAPTVGLWSARVRIKLGRWVEGAERYRQVVQISPPELVALEAQKLARVEAARELAELVPRIPTLTIVLEDAAASEVEVLFDDKHYPEEMFGIARPTNPGVHRVLVTRGDARMERTIDIKEAERKNIPVSLSTPPAPLLAAAAARPSKGSSEALAPQLSPKRAALTVPAADGSSAESNLWKPVGRTALALGAAGLIAWGVSSLVADAKLRDCPESGSEHWCPDESRASSYRTVKTVSMVAFWSGLALAAGGGSALLLGARSGRDAAPSIKLALDSNGIEVLGTF